MKKLRWTMDGQGFWEADVSTPKTIDGCAVPVPVSEHLLPLGLSRGIRLSRPKQIDFMQRFMSAPFIPFYSPSQGFALQRVFSIPFWDFGFPTFVCQFNLHKFINSFIIMMKEKKKRKKKNISSYGDHSSFLHHLSNKSLYALGFSSDFLLTPDDTLLISLDAYGDNNTIRTKALLHHKFLHHDLTMEALSPALFVDKSGNYWDVPVSLAIDLASSSSSSSFDSVSGLSYHLSMHHNAGSPTEQQTSPLPLPTSLLPGLSIKGALSLKKTFDIWRSKAHKLKMVQPYDIFLSNPHVSLLLITGAVATTYFGDNSVRSAAQDQFKGFHMQASRMKSAVLADVFASISLSAQYGMFQKKFLDLTRFCACLDFPSGSKFISGAMLLIEDHSNSQQPRTESIQAISPNARLSIQQQIAGPISLRVDSGVAIDLKKPGWVIQVEEPTIAVEYALQVLGSAKAIAWYSPKHREFMVELRFFEN